MFDQNLLECILYLFNKDKIDILIFFTLNDSLIKNQGVIHGGIQIIKH